MYVLSSCGKEKIRTLPILRFKNTRPSQPQWKNWKIERPWGRVTTKENMNGVVNQVPSQPELFPQVRTGLSYLTRYEVAHSHGNNFSARRYFSGFIFRQLLN